MKTVNFNQTEFVKSAASPSQFIRSSVPKVAFAGKSNVGKSSGINRILNRKNFAKVGANPGKTIHVNYFLADGHLYLVDLPGYGFAKVSREEKERWGKLMEEFFAEPGLMNLGVLIVDARHKPTADDCMMAEYLKNAGRPFLLVANKTDKVKSSELDKNLSLIRSTLTLGDEVKIIPFSAETGKNRELLISEILNAL